MLSCIKPPLFQLIDGSGSSLTHAHTHILIYICLVYFNYQAAILTWVEVFGFGQLNGGTRLFLQLYDGLAALANYRAGCIAGDQHLQEILTLLWGGDTQSRKGSHHLKWLHIIMYTTLLPNL